MELQQMTSSIGLCVMGFVEHDSVGCVLEIYPSEGAD